jgi:hypothetical protein
MDAASALKDMDSRRLLNQSKRRTNVKQPDKKVLSIEVPEEGNQCDFCGGEAGTDRGKDYACGKVKTSVITYAPSTWWACDPCAKLIDADDWEAVAQRGAAKVNEQFRSLYLMQLREAHQAFRLARREVQ